MKHLSAPILLATMLLNCGEDQQDRARSKALALGLSYQKLNEQDYGEFKNLYIQADSNKIQPVQLVILARAVRDIECQQTPCSLISIFDTEKAYQLSMSATLSASEQRYRQIHQVALFNVVAGTLTLYPLLARRRMIRDRVLQKQVLPVPTN